MIIWRRFFSVVERRSIIVGGCDHHVVDVVALLVRDVVLLVRANEGFLISCTVSWFHLLLTVCGRMKTSTSILLLIDRPAVAKTLTDEQL